jgi:hypothetical protein
MKRLRVLVVGSSLTQEDTDRVVNSLKYFAEEQLADELMSKLVFEDVVAKQEVHEIRDNASKYGYMLVLGNKAVRKLEQTSANVDVVECHTLCPAEWSGPMRERIIEQLKSFTESWVKKETESKLVKVAQDDKHEVEWIHQNADAFKRHIQLMVQNGRPHAVFFQKEESEAHCILKDATKRLRQPVEEVVPIVISSSCVREKTQKILEKNGYTKVFFMDIDEFMSHVMSMCMQMSGKAARIMVEPSDTEEQSPSDVDRSATAVAD